jgi:hypothetical protein
MVRHVLPLGFLLALAGCLSEDQPNNLIVQPGPFNPAPNLPPIRSHFAPATEEVGKRVATLGQQILLANPQLGMRPVFLTIGGTSGPEIFHRGQSQVILTESLAKQCTTDRLLAAALCLELGKMVSEREAIASVQARQPEREPPVESGIGTDSSFGASDLTRQAELAKYERNRRSAKGPPPPPPDPNVLARTYLAKAGFHAGDLDAAMPILQKAQENFQWEKQMTGTPPPLTPVKPKNPTDQPDTASTGPEK